MKLHQRLFSVTRTPYKVVVRFLFLKFFWRTKKFSPSRLRLIDESEYPSLLLEWYSLTLNGEKLNLHSPRTFNHKLQWLKFYGNRELMTRLADKIEVRRFVADRIGEKYLVPIIGVYNNSDEINWDDLPNRFVLKPNHGSHWVRIVECKSSESSAEILKEAASWLNEDYSVYGGFEMQYRGIKPRLVIERHLGELTHDLNDYKVWCFNGRAKFVQVFLDRYSATGCKTCFYTTDWQKQSFYQNYPLYEGDVKQPSSLPEMIACAEKLSAGIPFVRVDFYSLDDGTLRFGEMTFTPSSGACPWYGAKDIDRVLGDMLQLPEVDGHIVKTPVADLNIELSSNTNIKTLHILPDDKFTPVLIRFINRCFNARCHLFVISGGSSYKVPICSNVYNADLKHMNVPAHVRRVIFHSLFSSKSVSYLYNHKDVLSKSVWVIWGGDLYRPTRDKKNDYVRRHFPVVCGVEELEYRTRYNSSARFIPALTPSPSVSGHILDALYNPKTCQSDEIVIQINQQCHYSTLRIMKTLKRYWDDGRRFRIQTVVSYGYMEYRDEIIRIGRQWFGNNISFLESYLSPSDYAAFVNQADIVIVAFPQQAGIGLTMTAAYLGKKLFLCKTSMSYEYFKEQGLQMNEVESIDDMTWAEFARLNSQSIQNNHVFMKQYISDANFAKMWRPIIGC